MFGATKNLASEICVAPSIEFSSITTPLWLSWLGRCFSCKGWRFEPQSTNFFNCQISQFLGPARGGGVGTDGRTSFLTPPVNQKFSPTPKICLKLCSSSKIVDFTSFNRSLKLSNIRHVSTWMGDRLGEHAFALSS